MKRELIKTQDGSMTIFIPEMDETYHSTHGAIQEAEHVFIKHGLRKMEEKGLETIFIFEMGFGTGLNAFLTKIRSNSIVNYTGIEAFPVSENELISLNYVGQLGEEFKVDFDLIHSTSWKETVQLSSQFFIKKVHQKIEEYKLEKDKYDIIYFDAFGPRAQSEMWDIEILKNMYDGLMDGGMLVTYCAKGQFKRDLKSLGFEVESLPGPPGKREMTRAWKRAES
jgi:tRNA U34 5-methylaminomethyl-2-thiouridine-forming methyltransferase MnmC